MCDARRGGGGEGRGVEVAPPLLLLRRSGFARCDAGEDEEEGACPGLPEPARRCPTRLGFGLAGLFNAKWHWVLKATLSYADRAKCPSCPGLPGSARLGLGLAGLSQCQVALGYWKRPSLMLTDPNATCAHQFIADLFQHNTAIQLFPISAQQAFRKLSKGAVNRERRPLH